MKKNHILIIIILILMAGYMLSVGFKSGEDDPLTEDRAGVENKMRKSPVTIYPAPNQVSFAGEIVSLDEQDLIERYDNEIIVNTHFHSNTIMLLKKAHMWLPLFVPILDKYGIPEDFKYLPMIEGGLSNDRSPRGAVGFWQLLPSTARELGLVVNNEVDERYHPLRSTEAACKYLLRAKDKFGTWTNAAASYNMGMRGLARRMEQQRVDDYYDLLLNEETSRYIFRIIAIKSIVEDPEKYGFEIPEDQLYVMEQLDSVEVTETISDLTAFAFDKGINYKILKHYNPWLRSNSLTVNSRYPSFTITIPRKHRQSQQREIDISDSLMIGEDRIGEEPDNQQ